MLEGLDSTLEVLMKRELPAEIAARIALSFAAPDAQFPPAGVVHPVVNLFLYRIGENTTFRDNAPVVQRLPDGRAVKSRPPVFLDCSYLVTVWPDPARADAAADEHAILGAITQVLLAHPVLPVEVLQGALASSQGAPIAARLSGEDFKSPGDVWQALGGRQKLSLSYTVTFSVPVFAAEKSMLVTEKQIRFTTIETGAPA